MGFTKTTDNAILDTTTGLMWELKGSPEMLTWSKAQDYAASLTLDGFVDWRLPTVYELFALLNFEKVPADGDAAFAASVSALFETTGDGYWSGTEYARNLSSAWYVDFGDGYVGAFEKHNIFHVRAVRTNT